MAVNRTLLMSRALEEAAKARGRTRPNPMVGCLIAHGNTVIAVGHHRRAGTAHAEVAALRKAGVRARGADAYVTLEPCAHTGRTGPCADALIAAGVRRVFVAMRDPNPLVNGRGTRKLRRAGIIVESGLCAAESKKLNEAFICSMQKQRPMVIAKIAQSLDGLVATAQGESQWITSPAARRHGHQLRGQCDAIAVGIGTVLADDPRLTCRVRGGLDPARVVVDSNARTPTKSRIIATAASSVAPTLIMVADTAPALRVRALKRAGDNVHVVECPTHQGRVDLPAVFQQLHHMQIRSLLVEGGPTLLGNLFGGGWVDKVHAYIAPRVIGGAGALSAVGGAGVQRLADANYLRDVQISPVGPDWHLVGYV